MTTTRVHWVRDASRAFEEALAELVGGGQPVVDAAELGRQAALEAVAGSLWGEQLGPVYDSEGVMALLGGVTKQAVSDRVRRHALLALRTGSGRLVYPAFQFDGRRVIDGLAAVLAVVVPDDTEAWYVASWLTTPDPALGGLAPYEALRAGELEAVRAAAYEVATALRG